MSERDELIECLRVCGACHGCGIGADGDTCTNCGDERQLNRLAASLLERDGAELERLRTEVERLRQLCAAAYQMAGVVGAPLRFLDALSRHDDVTQEQIDALLPVFPHEFDAGFRDTPVPVPPGAGVSTVEGGRSVPAVPNPLMIVDVQTNTAYVGDKADEMVDAGIAEWTRAAQQAGAS